MKKKVIYITITIIILIIMIIIYFLWNKADTIKKYDLFEAIPTNSMLIADIKDSETLLKKLENENEISKSLFHISGVDSENSLLHILDSINNIEGLQTKILKSRILYSVCIEGTSIQQICILNIPDNQKEKKFTATFTEELKKIGSLKSRIYNEVEITEFTTKNNKKVHFFIKNNILAFSFSSKSIENSIEALKNTENSILSEKGLKNIRSTAGKNEMANLYVNIKKVPGLVANLINPEKSDELKNFKHFSGWTELDLNITGDRLNLNGFINKNDSIPNFVNIPDSQNPVEITSLEVLPNTTSCYIAFAFNNKQEYDNSLTEYLKAIGKNDEREHKIENLKKVYGINIKNIFYPMVENEICFAVTSMQEKDLYSNSFTVFNVNSQSAAKQELQNMIETLSKKLNKPVDSFTEILKIDQNTQIECFVFPFEELPEILFGTAFKKCTGKYVCCIKNFVVFANTKEALFKFVYDAVLNNTLSTSIEHNLFLEHFSGKSNMFLYFSFFKGFDIFKDLMTDEIGKKLFDERESIYKLGDFGYQINKSKEMLYNNIVIKYSENIELKSQTLWESRLDTVISMKPFIVINHDNNAKEILVQDSQNTLYLLSSSGRIIWKIKLDEQIMGKVYQIDFYKNNKLQYLFSTVSKIHIIDRLGNYIEKYPLELREKATAPMSLFDYENNKNYRIIIPCEDQKVYLYDLEGVLIKGWDFGSTENIVRTDINHYRIKKEDYIVFNDDYKSYFLLRNGSSKLNFVSKFRFSKKNNIWLDSSVKTPNFVTTDENGTLRFFNTNGKQDSLFIRKFSADHTFALKDVNCDGKNDYVFSDGNKLEVYNNSKKLILSYEFESDITYEPSFYSFPGNKIMIGIVCADTGKIYLIDSTGNIFDGFPLHGASRFSIGNLSSDNNTFNLVVGDYNNLLYNYEIKY
ncbi:MAG: DUF3352 domain-containing protein [Bacteroidales bacterium]|jgi:hypothetical protein|nr:DUF3352 domain-containing protein [Bacteroidales bacterium]